MKLPTIHLGKRRALQLAVTAIAGAGLYATITPVHSNQMAVRQTLGEVTSDHPMGPGIYFQVPLVQFTHVYDTNAQKIEFNAGSNRWFLPLRSTTSDQNTLIAEVGVNYKIQPDEQNLIFHRWAMRSWLGKPNGYFLLTEMLNDSANAVLGRQTMAQALSDPQKFTNDLSQDLTQRLALNNVPIQIQFLEVKGLKTTIFPTHSVSYNVVGKSAPPANQF